MSEFGEVPSGCWETARVDPNADFMGAESVFGYGSLTWKPPADTSEIKSFSLGYIKGWCRRFWQASVDHRGTPENPGRVVTILQASYQKSFSSCFQ
eukprot:m.237979 g.237979  ORF g.237979 m.237979 type:complete len:96 (-) comp16058_c0_seq9:2584-2871(-)